MATAAPPLEPPTPPFVAGYDRFFQYSAEPPHVGGALLLSELSCTACHSTDDANLKPKRGPRLDGAGLRLQTEWMRRYIANPHSEKPGTTMPDLLLAKSPEDTERAVRALVAFLSSQRKPFPELNSTAGNPIAFEFWKKGSPDRGRTLYHQVGCVACHEPDAEFAAGLQPASDLENFLAQLEPDEIRELGLENATRPVRSVPHGNLIGKYTRQALTYFLLDPNETRPAGQMPNLKLKPDEAADVAAYLLRGQAEDTQPTASAKDDRLIDEGSRLFVELRCVNCHDVTEPKPLHLAKPLAQLDIDADRSCVSSPREGLPHFGTSAAQVNSLRKTLAVVKSPQPSEHPASEAVHFQMLQLNCYACHERENRGGIGPQRRGYFETVGHVDLGDEGRLPPPLDGVGRKLTNAWFKKVLAGDGDIRPHMFVRMPVFAATAVVRLPESFAMADTSGSQPGRDLRSSVELVEAGRSLLDLGCVQCHPLRGEYLPGVLGVDLASIAARVQPLWFRDFLLNPAELKSRTRMPTFFPNGRSGVPTILDGDVDRQIAAMWTYLKDIDRQALPDRLASSKVHNFELIPEDRPILLRTFMVGAGTQAIAVGFPTQVHVAFDAESVRFALAWRGRFIDAHGTWFDRFSPPAVPLGDDLVTLPAGAPLALLADTKENWPDTSGDESGYKFRGYRLDRDGTPTFLYRFDHYDVEDRLAPTSDKQLARMLLIRKTKVVNDNHVLWFRVNAGKSLRKLNDTAYANEAGLTTSVSTDAAHRSVLRSANNDIAEWIIPVDIEQNATIEVEYQW
jgi:mono/diheme cytochrome c family protein